MTFLKKSALPLLYGAVCLLLLAAGARWDLALDRFLYDPKDPFAIFMEAFCWLPAYLPLVLQFLVWSRLPAKSTRRAGVFLAGLAVVILTAVGADHLIGRQVSLPVTCAVSLAVGAFLGLCCVWLYRPLGRPAVRIRLDFMAKTGILYTLLREVCIKLLKTLWTRMRFDDMLAAGSFDAFTPFWEWGSQPGNTSFPSGHTASAAAILFVMLLPVLFERFKDKRLPLALSCFAWIALSGYSRLRIGRHFLSDTVGAALFMGGLWLLITRLPVFRRRLDQTLAAARAAGRE